MSPTSHHSQALVTSGIYQTARESVTLTIDIHSIEFPDEPLGFEIAIDDLQ